MIAIIDYGAGNTRSVSFALERLGKSFEITSDLEKIARASHVILPGVGHAEPAMARLRELQIDQLLPELKQPVLGICLGMQLLCSHTEEGNVKGLEVFETKVRKFELTDLSVPHTGWNEVKTDNDLLFKGISDQSDFYFVHSYYVEPCEAMIGSSTYGHPISVALNKDNFYATQFHPEKSGETGKLLIKNFIEL